MKTPSAIKNSEKLDHLNITSGNVKCYNHFGKVYCRF